jgi:L-methionine (R)-S-oxide reductase
MGMQNLLGDNPKPYLTGFWPTDLANFSAFVYHSLPRLNWAGFYLYTGKKLQLGPFQGKPACMEIALGKGVCGNSFVAHKSILVPDVHEYPGHIACDSASRSEMVVPLLWGGDQPWGVFDLDSPERDRFSIDDQKLVMDWLKILETSVQSRHPQSPWKE